MLNAADPLVWAMRERTVARVLSWSIDGAPEGPGVWASGLTGDPLGRYGFGLHSVGLDRSDG